MSSEVQGEETPLETQEEGRQEVYDLVNHLQAILGLAPKSYYLSDELALAFRVSRVSIQRTAKKYGIGKISKCERGSRGIRIFMPEDVAKLSQHIQRKG